MEHFIKIKGKNPVFSCTGREIHQLYNASFRSLSSVNQFNLAFYNFLCGEMELGTQICCRISQAELHIRHSMIYLW